MSESQGSSLEHRIAPEESGERIDRLVARVAGISVQRAKELVEGGRVRIDHRRPRKGDRAQPGALLSVEGSLSEAPVPQPELPLAVLHEDEWLLALDKPAGMAMHPLRPGETGTLANAVLARFPDVAGASDEARCPGLVHRLDRETSGVVLWARRPEAFAALRAQLAARSVEKRYWALVEGEVEGEGELAVPLAHEPGDARRMLATPYPAEAEKLGALPAVTRWRALARGGGATLVEALIPTGVMHQIRVHFSFAGHPVLGDQLYGGRPLDGLERHFLHALSLGFDHPEDGRRVTLTAPLPPELEAALSARGIARPA